jgi:hypothetical protein
MQPKLTGRVLDARTGAPIPNARVAVGTDVFSTDSEGSYTLKHRPTIGQVTVLVPGYKRGQVDLAQQTGLDVKVEPFEVHAMYMTYFAIGGDDYRQTMYHLPRRPRSTRW